MGTVGIQKALVKNVNVKTTKNYGGNVLVELIEDNASLEAYVDETCLGANTQKPKKTLENVRWLLIRQHVWTNYRSLYPTMDKQEFFNTLINSLDSKDYKLFNGNEVKITKEDILSQSPIGNLGAIYMLMPYNNFPEYEIGNVYIVALGKPQILYTQFKFPKNGYIPLEHHDRRATYGQTVNVEVYTHLLPDCRSQGKQFDFEVELFNERGEVLSKSGLESLKCDGEYSYNNRHKLSFLIDIDWQKKHVDKEKEEKFYLRIKGRERFSQPSIYDPDRVVFNEDEYNSKENNINWKRFERGKWVYDSSGVLLVPFDTFAEMMGRFETQKNNTIQYIGDIKYTKREFDPCGYSKITIQDKEDKERAPLVIFDETALSGDMDKTDHIFSIIAGDERKDITITLDGLQTKNQFCQGLLLDEGQKHTIPKNVFQVEKVYSAFHDGKFYPTYRDDEHQHQQREAGIDITEANKHDTDVRKSDKAAANPSAVQQWTEGEDYEIVSDKEITLKLRYLYNKTFLEGSIQNSSIARVADNLWLFRYFWLSEKLAQTYFVPISTCRYPNQLAKIRVYPDIEWEVSFIITTGETHTLSGGVKEDISDYPVRHNLKFSDKFKLSSEYKGFSFATDISVKVNGDVHKLGFDKIENLIKKLADLKAFLDKFNSNNSANANAGGFTEYFSFKLVSPNIALAFKWNIGHVVEKENNHKAVTMLSGAFKLAPLIGVNFEVDLFVITDNIKVYFIGDITKFIRKSIEWVLEADIFVMAFVNIELNGEFTLVYNSINGFDDKKSNRKAILSIPFGVKGGIKSNEENVIILPTGEKMEKFNAEISVNSGIDIVEELGTDNIGPYKKNSYIFKGLNVKVVIVENVFRRNKISVVPKIEETFEILKEDKICPDSIEYLKN